MDFGVLLPERFRILALRNPLCVTKIIDPEFFKGDYFVSTTSKCKQYLVLLYSCLN